MGLIYNERTAVPRDIKSARDEENTFLADNNILDSDSNAQTKNFFHAFNSVGLSNESFFLTEDIILTHIHGHATGFTASLNTASNIIVDGTDVTLPIPNWRLKKGEILYSSVSGGGLNWIGYYVN